jgi:hypothetical protein
MLMCIFCVFASLTTDFVLEIDEKSEWCEPFRCRQNFIHHEHDHLVVGEDFDQPPDGVVGL